jgi:dUTP pyrophosphatase
MTDRLANCTVTKVGFDQITVNLEVMLKHPEAKLPFRKRETDAGYDIYSVESVTLPPNRATIVHTGIHIASPPGFYYTIEGRSGLWKQGIFPNRGIIDATYTGEVVVSLVNVNNNHFQINVGNRIAQIILHRQYDATFKAVEEFSRCYSERGTDGFGSSGR